MNLTYTEPRSDSWIRRSIRRAPERHRRRAHPLLQRGRNHRQGGRRLQARAARSDRVRLRQQLLRRHRFHRGRARRRGAGRTPPGQGQRGAPDAARHRRDYYVMVDGDDTYPAEARRSSWRRSWPTRPTWWWATASPTAPTARRTTARSTASATTSCACSSSGSTASSSPTS